MSETIQICSKFWRIFLNMYFYAMPELGRRGILLIFSHNTDSQVTGMYKILSKLLKSFASPKLTNNNIICLRPGGLLNFDNCESFV